MIGKIALGTVQFGIDYGITNERGKIPFDECRSILVSAQADGIDLLDTASAYGESEEVIGRVQSEHELSFEIVSKLPDVPVDQLTNVLTRSLSNLKCSRLYGYLVHDPDTLHRHPDLWRGLKDLRDKKMVRKIGISANYPDDINRLLDRDIVPDLVQFPFNILDRRFEPILKPLADLGVEIHIRSVFLQGLLLQDPEQLQPSFLAIRDRLRRLRKLSAAAGVSTAAILLDFALSTDYISKVVVGVDGIDSYRRNVQGVLTYRNSDSLNRALHDFRLDDENIIVPSLWSK